MPSLNAPINLTITHAHPRRPYGGRAGPRRRAAEKSQWWPGAAGNLRGAVGGTRCQPPPTAMYILYHTRVYLSITVCVSRYTTSTHGMPTPRRPRSELSNHCSRQPSSSAAAGSRSGARHGMRCSGAQCGTACAATGAAEQQRCNSDGWWCVARATAATRRGTRPG